MKLSADGRLMFVSAAISLAGAAIIGRLFFLQIISHSYYATLEERQSVASTDTSPRRGTIYFSGLDDARIPAATVASGFLLYVNPRTIADPAGTYESLKPFLAISREEFLKRAERKDDPYEVVAHHLSDADVEQVRLLGEPGVGTAPEEWRRYPGGTIASHVLGFVGYDGDRLVGRYGIERSEESALSVGRPLGGLSSAFFEWSKKLFHTPAEGSDVVLTLEPEAQYFVEKTLDAIVKRWMPERAGVILMEPKTGKILAMAARPNFDPNVYNEAPSLDVFTNPLVESVYELGSIFKPLTFAAAIDLGKITPETTYHDSGFVEIGGKRIENFDGKGRGTISMQTALDESLNTGAVFVEKTIGGAALRDYFDAYGLADKTEVELPGEVLGKLSNLDRGSEVDFASAAFGQGVAVTPLAYLRAASALANGGMLVKPYIVERVAVEGGPDVVAPLLAPKRVLKQETAETMTRMLAHVADFALLGGTVKNPRYSLAVKTGTAQMAKAGGGGYSDEYLHSFFGYGPAYDAKFAILLFMTKPHGERYAARTLTAPFMEIMDFLLNYYRVPPDR